MALLSGCHITPLEKPFLFLQDSAMFAGTKQFSLRHTNPVRLRVLPGKFCKSSVPSHQSCVLCVAPKYHHNYKTHCQGNHNLNHPAAQALTIQLTHSRQSAIQFCTMPATHNNNTTHLCIRLQIIIGH